MIRLGASLTLTAIAASLVMTGIAAAAPAPIVFFDIAGTDLAGQAVFYKAVFGWDAAADGRLTVPVAAPLPGNLRVESPSQGPVAERVLYVGVPDINAALETMKAHGGSVVFGRTVAPGIVILALFKDPAGNRMGLVELDGAGKPIVPKAP
jgi:predicted enzyme related to lactoylglutathione lyase